MSNQWFNNYKTNKFTHLLNVFKNPIYSIHSSIVVLYTLNVLDLIFTYNGLKKQYLIESNPIMNRIYQYNPFLFVLCKLLGVLLCIYPINLLYKKKKWVANSVLGLNIIYVYIFILHIYILISI
ncbi:DUF5658 family protein [Alkaliphilus sp. B6464]|uniref:DUF5658 family protein n=1 Tax=Alkaliphilus sp. B6464 TaxID=2731219 RepID=UPI003FA46A7A